MRFFILLLLFCLCCPSTQTLYAGQSNPVLSHTYSHLGAVSPVEPLPKKAKKPFWKRPFHKKQKGEELSRASYWFMISWTIGICVLIFMFTFIRLTADPLFAWYWITLSVLGFLALISLFMYMIGLVLAVSYTTEGWLLKNRFWLGYLSLGFLGLHLFNYALAFMLEYPGSLVAALFLIVFILFVVFGLPILLFNIKDQASMPTPEEEQR